MGVILFGKQGADTMTDNNCLDKTCRSPVACEGFGYCRQLNFPRDVLELLQDPIAVHLNMLRGTIAKPTIENIIHLYGKDALLKALQ
jgi:hypothetical protein